MFTTQALPINDSEPGWRNRCLFYAAAFVPEMLCTGVCGTECLAAFEHFRSWQ